MASRWFGGSLGQPIVCDAGWTDFTSGRLDTCAASGVRRVLSNGPSSAGRHYAREHSQAGRPTDQAAECHPQIEGILAVLSAARMLF